MDKHRFRKRNLAHLFVVGVLIALFFTQSENIRSATESFFVSVGGGVMKFGASFAERFSSTALFFESKKKLAAENEELKNILASARLRILASEALMEENETLKALLGRKDEKRKEILAVVLSRPNRSPYDTFFLDVGIEHGVSLRSLVTFENIVLGKIEAVSQMSSKVRLFSSFGNKIDVVLGPKKIPAVAKGTGGGMFTIELPREIGVSEGDTVFYPSLLPYIVGTVSAIKAKPSDALQTLTFRSPMNIFTTQFVTVIPQTDISSGE